MFLHMNIMGLFVAKLFAIEEVSTELMYFVDDDL